MPAGTGDARGLPTRAERDRAAALRSAADRDGFVAAHALVRLRAAELLGLPARSLTVVQGRGRCERPHGRPALAGLAGVGLSLARTGGRVAAAASRGPAGIGIEADDGGDEVDPVLVEGACGPGETAARRHAPDPRRTLLRQRVRKESPVEVGAASLDEPGRTDLPLRGGPPARPVAHRPVGAGGGRLCGGPRTGAAADGVRRRVRTIPVKD
ncbi:phosphopantetheinyl transferase [Streptomyces wuyuanensis]|uniref:phosphopantetheinyl transferase n=1 Tax=Streptomyces wuyuanensis TaxID=1196353 RepID=UPI0037B64758